MKHLIFYSLPLLLFIISCTENNPTESRTYTDSELKAKIVGTWANDYTNISYDANGNFVANIDIDYTIGDTTVNQSEVITGTYEIENGILMKNISEWEIINNSHLGGGYMVPASKIIFLKNLLYQYYLNILTRIGDDSDSLWGEWYTYDWAHHYSNPAVFGKFEQTFNFDKDSMTVTRGSRVSYDSIAGFYYYTASLLYNPPDISWENHSPRIIEFHGGQMWMFYKPSSTPKPLKKIK